MSFLKGGSGWGDDKSSVFRDRTLLTLGVAAERRGRIQKLDESRHAATSRWGEGGDGLLCGCEVGIILSRRFQPVSSKFRPGKFSASRAWPTTSECL